MSNMCAMVSIFLSLSSVTAGAFEQKRCTDTVDIFMGKISKRTALQSRTASDCLCKSGKLNAFSTLQEMWHVGD